jgi:hypothetical protein
MRRRARARNDMTIGRRFFIGLALGCGAALHPLRALAALMGPTGGEPYPLTALRPYVYTLIPIDDRASATDTCAIWRGSTPVTSGCCNRDANGWTTGPRRWAPTNSRHSTRPSGKRS